MDSSDIPAANQTILIADDDESIRQVLMILLRSVGYRIELVGNGSDLIQRAQVIMPHLLLIDVMMPDMDGYEALRQLRNDTRTAHIPAIMLTARGEPKDLVHGFDSGADDYVIKPFNTVELIARVRSQLRRATRKPVRSPLTGLAGNVLIAEELRFRLRREEPFVLLYADLNNFKPFNDIYGFARGDRVIRLAADVIVACVARIGEHDFVGHIGGDDFAIITTPQHITPICRAILTDFGLQVQELYDPADLERGYLEGVDRHGIYRQFPITTFSIGGVTNRYEQFAGPDEIGQRAAEMKAQAKSLPYGSYVVDGEIENAFAS
ncbi:response regulator receiver modulated diguanylate cyclase [Oscillochloris trichoides DG-6]|uniref:Response regulator receiver modulated diguanylate cyclase n=1 Tax=Oscillochloris trichoides DG-6 TaxID=765420 RepID=E1IEI0_9CHLR|nr:diguanylate cyclase [Oscillochloris trichoides]EFO80372.1 response regulator receiver modulated diguanylate cyclase [Oscillochloris trichoides DG-6]